MIVRGLWYSIVLLCGGAVTGGCAEPMLTTLTPGRHVTLFSRLSPDKATPVQLEADRTVREISEFLGLATPEGQAQVMLFNSARAFRAFVERECPQQSGAGAACFQRGDTFVVALHDHWSSSETLKFLRHELSHYVIASHFYDIPPWIDEGLAQFFEMGTPYGRAHPACLGPLAAQLRRERQGVLSHLVAARPGTRLSREEYDQAWGLTHFLLKRPGAGPASVRRYLEQARSDKDALDLFRAVFGQGPSDMESAWRAHVLSLSAQDKSR
ncbi:MAG: hypothetical protein FJ278_12790 [Planctomycetes bacterium]|nr:hypothetical protein [Planctomycetota bacterium]